MGGACKNYFREKDELGNSIQLNYKQRPTFGTTVGGFFSCVTTVFITAFVCVQIYAWMFEPAYNQQISTTYVTRGELEPYDIPYTAFLPYFAIFDEGGKFNNKEYFSFGFRQKTQSYTELVEIPAVSCIDLIEEN